MDTNELLKPGVPVRLARVWRAGGVSRREALRRLGLLGLSLPTASAILAACTSADSSSTTPRTSSRSKIIVGIVQEPTSLDPTADATNAIAVCLRDNLYEGLVRLDANGRLIGGLARSWDQSPDGTRITFHLASGVTWHDGSPFSAQDVKFSWERAADASTRPPNPHRDYWAAVRSIDIADDTTVTATLSAYSDNFLFHMAAGSACIVSSKSAGSNMTNPIGTGPFKFTAWNRGASLALSRNDAYWGANPQLRDVEFRFISDAEAMNNALRAGDIDAIGQVGGPEQISGFVQDPSFSVVRGAPTGKFMVSVNQTSGPLADRRVRQALYAAIDRTAWITGVGADGVAVPIGSHAAPNGGEPYYADMTSVNTYDPAKAMQLLAAAGQASLRLRLAQIPYPYAMRGADILGSQLRAIGVSLEIQPMDFGRWFQEVFTAHNYDLTIINHAEERDIGNYANPNYYWHYNNAQVADWLKQADAEFDAAKRTALYGQVQRQLAADAANLWIYSANQLAVVKHNLTGLQMPGIAPSLYLAEASFT
jgi:peptide/nickel transport system substrate-binding protein